MPRRAKENEKTVWSETRKQLYFEKNAGKKASFQSMFDDWKMNQDCDLGDNPRLEFIRYLVSILDFRLILLIVSKPDFQLSFLDDIIGSTTHLYITNICTKYYSIVENCFTTEMAKRQIHPIDLHELGILEQNTFDIYSQNKNWRKTIGIHEIYNYGYQMNSSFFLKELPFFRKTGYLLDAIQTSLAEMKLPVHKWLKLDMKERMIKGYEAVLEYFVYTGKMLVLGSVLTDRAIHANRYNTQTWNDLVYALGRGQCVQVANLIKLYYDVPLTYKRFYRAKITRLRASILSFCNKNDHHIVREWISGDFETESNQKRNRSSNEQEQLKDNLADT